MASLAPAAAAADNQTTTARALYTPYLTLVLPNTTLVSALAPQPRTSALSPTATPVSADDESAYRRAHEPHGASSSSGAAGGRHAVVDFERLKFRLVFILWPAVVGLTMAM
ncbi:uncharacterized protein PHACADRAFT_266345 [Phanerochaete carnosa HHB-10118-sp]|uniref:Uncharacterized protein n=1 Tax=Phanerochaete carnosa (strain HHB-10118-sp) TaxID=650164 RepID=K5UG66_PHACS|nr:uncharacterized protein PHACADRAFT_266345 [Phanerochaete carnosa HHB-10118-sp]EKM48461.1 hypothetical protein PHACADRAFT_266345 [Phanerochaete carnosa HHB-10118-sp]